MLRLKDFDYHLPLDLIAQQPIKPRDHSRLLLLNRRLGTIRHQHFYNITDHLRPGDVLVLNNSKVFPARLIGAKEGTGGQVEIFLHRPLAVGSENKKPVGTSSQEFWECLVGGRIKEGQKIIFYDRSKGKAPVSGGLKPLDFRAVVVKDNQDGTWQVRFNLSGRNFWRTVNRIGEVPLPPYIKRSKPLVSDKSSYQTVFASRRQLGSAAAPTAGLHFTKKLLKEIKARGVDIVYVTLHVGLGTFAPVKTEKIVDHKMHREFAIINSMAIRRIIKARERGGRVIAVGTTSCRTLESLDWTPFLKVDHRLAPISSRAFWTDIFIYPGYNFKIVDALITNFHLPKSTLIMLISALAGQRLVESAYREAISRHYRFFSYGDAMFIY
ncbi:MAG: tRNA preQ1(34) S-adenosylmethionine ribosyltransferase-isomerase QueA [Patescibacteria group bacterium]|jgi:S-adenosylmethionine:tRNA ribosyltransferase-isomerase